MPISSDIKVIIDDFGSTHDSNTAILSLLGQRNFFHGVSCIVTSDDTNKMADDFKALSKLPVRVGLHLTFTDFRYLTTGQPMPGNFNIFGLHFNKSRTFLGEEIKAQVEKFKELLGRYPDFIDGHHHIHQSPYYLGSLIEFLNETPSLTDSPDFFVRVSKVPSQVLWTMCKFNRSIFLKNLGLSSYALLATLFLKMNKIKVNDILLGGYSLDATKMEYSQIFEFYKRLIVPPGKFIVFFCHPGAKEYDRSLQREVSFKHEEYLYFKGQGNCE